MDNNAVFVQNTNIPFKQVTIIGVGLIGGSIAAALKALPPEQQPLVRGIDISEHTIASALGKGLLDEGAICTNGQVDLWLSDASDASEVSATTATTATAVPAVPAGAGKNDVLDDSLIILATPVASAGDWLKRIAQAGYSGVLTDVASTKGLLTKQAISILMYPERYIPGHPMAGSEVNGIEGARATLFNGAHWILCPDATSDAQAYLRLHDLVTALGARSITVPREDHDEAIALVSHVPHMVASALVQLVGSHACDTQEIFRLAAGGFKDTTRIAAGSPALWSGIALDNRQALAASLNEIRDIINSFEKAITTGDERTLTNLLENAAQLRKAIPATWVPDSERLVEVRISMANRSGVIAEVTTLAAKAGCNIQSIDIDHINEGTAILELILTDEGDFGRFTNMLINAGFDMSLRPLLPTSS